MLMGMDVKTAFLYAELDEAEAAEAAVVTPASSSGGTAAPDMPSAIAAPGGASPIP